MGGGGGGKEQREGGGGGGGGGGKVIVAHLAHCKGEHFLNLLVVQHNVRGPDLFRTHKNSL